MRPDQESSEQQSSEQSTAVILCLYLKSSKPPGHPEFSEPTRYSLLNAFTETIKKYTPLRVDHSYMALNRCFGLDGNRPELW